ncbi:MAG: isoprenyl transferase [Proteobacteria bacterium]|nr:isoprenyl transferase [Pseudomonadota bacterium]
MCQNNYTLSSHSNQTQSHTVLERSSSLPRHIGIIMDGNGRWAKQKHFPRVLGHRSAIKTVRTIVESCAELGVGALTLYAFSTENWERPKTEVEFLMKLFEEFLQKELNTLMDNNIRLQLFGNKKGLPEAVQAPLEKALEKSKNNTGMALCLAINYGSRDEIKQACQSISQKVKDGKLKISEIDEQTISANLYTKDLEDPDLIIRTSGELRLSNFLLWQAAYAEFYFTETLWPDFTREELMLAIENYRQRVRRLGKVKDE